MATNTPVARGTPGYYPSGGGFGFLSPVLKPTLGAINWSQQQIDKTPLVGKANQWIKNNPQSWPWIMAALSGGTLAATDAFGAGAGAGITSSSTFDPFTGTSGAWAPIGGAGAPGGLGAAGNTLTSVPGGTGGVGGYYTPAGTWVSGTPGGDFGQLLAKTPWYQSFLGQTAINTGANLLGGVLQNRAIGSAQKKQQQAIQSRIRQALMTLSPEHIMALSQQFLPQMAANSNAAGQTAIAALREQAARTGQLEGPRELSVEAGARAALSQDVQRQAFERAFNLAGGQASAITGAPYTPIQPQMGVAQALIDSANQAYAANFYNQANKQNALYGTPYRWPGAPQVVGG